MWCCLVRDRSLGMGLLPGYGSAPWVWVCSLGMGPLLGYGSPPWVWVVLHAMCWSSVTQHARALLKLEIWRGSTGRIGKPILEFTQMLHIFSVGTSDAYISVSTLQGDKDPFLKDSHILLHRHREISRVSCSVLRECHRNLF